MCLSLKRWRGQCQHQATSGENIQKRPANPVRAMPSEIPPSNKWVRTEGAKRPFNYKDRGLGYREPYLSCCLDTVKLQTSMQLKMGEMATSIRQGSLPQLIELEYRTSHSGRYRDIFGLLEMNSQASGCDCYHILESGICSMRNCYVQKSTHGKQKPKCLEGAFSDSL